MARKDARRQSDRNSQANTPEQSNGAGPSKRLGQPKPPGVGQRRWMLVLAAMLVIGASLFARGFVGGGEAEARTPRAAKGAGHRVETVGAELPAGGPTHDVMAIVNGADISRQTLVKACVERHGEDVLESLVNKRLIDHHCRKRGVSVTPAEIDAEVDRMASRFKLGREQWLQMLASQRGVDETEYKRDILWPTLALRKLAADKVNPTDEELQQAYETTYGPSVRVRLIVVSDKATADKVHRQAVAQPDEFPRLAMQNSKDVNSASIGGLIQPIRLHAGDKQVERAAFNLKAGEISQVVKAGQQYVILKCEGRNPPRNVPMASVRDNLAEGIVEQKLRGVANNLFKQLQDNATIQNVYNDADLREAMPGVVATVNGDKVTMKELGRECLDRHGEEVLQVEVSHLLLRQRLKSSGVVVTQGDLEDEMRHAALLAGVVGPDGRADLPRWRQMASVEQDMSYDQYVRDSVWPSAALKKLTSGRVEITDEDLQKGFQANYGEKVRCRAIVMGSLRRAQEVWDKARENQSMDYFGDLAEEYSIEPSSRSLRGEVPLIRRFGGQPQLEEAAFALSEGELSGIIQVGDKFLVLKCEGRAESIGVSMGEVVEELKRDIFEKKLRLAMSSEFDRIRAEARIDNYLAGTTQAPAGKNTKQASRRRDGKVRPTAGVR